jgi:hypothetical protein
MSATMGRNCDKERRSRVVQMMPHCRCFGADKQAQLSHGAEIFLATPG